MAKKLASKNNVMKYFLIVLIIILAILIIAVFWRLLGKNKNESFSMEHFASTEPKPTDNAPKPRNSSPKPKNTLPKPTDNEPKPTNNSPKPTNNSPKPQNVSGATTKNNEKKFVRKMSSQRPVSPSASQNAPVNPDSILSYLNTSGFIIPAVGSNMRTTIPIGSLPEKSLVKVIGYAYTKGCQGKKYCEYSDLDKKTGHICSAQVDKAMVPYCWTIKVQTLNSAGVPLPNQFSYVDVDHLTTPEL